jgi:glycosyltransferase involved in cell wall biosynthesis
LVEELNINEWVEFLWPISLEELVKSYQKAQATLFASIDEPFWMVPIESMACWTIAIWHNSWGMKETIPDEYRYKDEKELLKIMEWKFNDSVNVNNFTWNSTVKSILNKL